MLRGTIYLLILSWMTLGGYYYAYNKKAQSVKDKQDVIDRLSASDKTQQLTIETLKAQQSIMDSRVVALDKRREHWRQAYYKNQNTLTRLKRDDQSIKKWASATYPADID